MDRDSAYDVLHLFFSEHSLRLDVADARVVGDEETGWSFAFERCSYMVSPDGTVLCLSE